ncbi:MAG: biotin-dependent carboxyltransferase family protein [Paracoccaceae bacterium]|nr:biotin-dependent carboxyltransferase family protein [Paracoccaceae bacterium]
MKAALRLTRCGPWVSVQDRGRPGYQRYGISESGAMDPVSLVIANRLAGNGPGEACLEVGGPGLTMTPEGDEATVAVAGPAPRVWLDGGEITGNRGFRLAPGRTFRVAPSPSSAFVYLAAHGGFELSPMFDSLSFHARSGIGGTGEGALGEGAVLPVKGPAGPELALAEHPPIAPAKIAILKGPQFDHLEPGSWEALLETSWKIGARSDRMGVRLEGPVLKHTDKGYNIVSDGIALGSVQLPGDGKPIVLAADRQTTGGYPKIAVIARADMPHFAQLPAGTFVRFREVTLEAAIGLLKTRAQRIARLKIGPVGRGLDSESLLSVNLIGGVIRG